MYMTHLECSACFARHDADVLQNLCTVCGKPLFARYDLEAIARSAFRQDLPSRCGSMWRFRELLPVASPANIITLGEGSTPLLRAKRLGDALGMQRLFIKDESPNPTGSFKARGMAAAVSRARELGVRKLAAPSAGNAGGALAAYAARAGMEAHVFVPADTPRANIVEAQVAGAHVTLVDGLITDCAARVASGREKHGWFDVSTLKEPYRLEGKKTLGFELAEQLGWVLPDVILYPTGGGTGLIGMWKAFDELEALGWIGSERPRMISVQAEGCAPIVRAFEQESSAAAEVAHAHTVASGLRVPRAIGDFLILNILRQSRGNAVAVSDQELLFAVSEIAACEGIFAAPEGAACLPALRSLLNSHDVDAAELVVVFNTGTGIKYIDALE